MATKKESDDRVIQHVPAHLEKDAKVFDPRHPAASAFAVAQPAAGVVSDDADKRGQNLAGGPTASEAEKEYADQGDVLKENYERDLKAANPAPPAAVTLQTDKAGHVTGAKASDK